ncbi:hypothetical protein P5V15_006635 [Pogonomyrmex californicus]
MQFGHENIFNLLVQVYGKYRLRNDGGIIPRNSHMQLMTYRENVFSGANQDVRDYSGRKARQYLASQEAAVSQDTFHSEYILSAKKNLASAT